MPRKRTSMTGELKTKTIRVCVTETEYEAIKARARSLSMSAYLLRCGLGEVIAPTRLRPSIPAINRMTYIELGKICTLLEQMMERAEPVDAAAWPVLHDQINQVRLQLVGVGAEQLAEAEEF